MTSSINRTYHPKYLTYTGDGSGRDGHIVFGNGGLHDMRDYRGPSPKPGFDQNRGRSPKPYAAAHKEPTAFDYVPDGSGRDSYVIFNYGLKANYRSSYREFERGLRSDEATPLMDARHARKKDPWGTDISSYNNWHSPKVRQKQRHVYNEQRASVERLSKSPPKNNSRSKLSSTERMDALKSSIKKPKARLVPEFRPIQVDIDHEPHSAEKFFSARNGPQTIDAGTAGNLRIQRKNLDLNKGFMTTQQQKASHLHSRKMLLQATMQPTVKKDEDLLSASESKVRDFTSALQKKLSIVPRVRAQSTLQYAHPMPVAPRGLTTADPQIRNGVRVKRVGNLVTLEKDYPGARRTSYNRTMAPENIAPKVLFRQQNSPMNEYTANELTQLQQQNQTLRERLYLQKQGGVEPAFGFVSQKSTSAMDRNLKTVTLTQELALKKMETDLTKGMASTMVDSSANGTKFGERRSTHIASRDYASFENSPLKVDGRGTIVMKQLLDRRSSIGTRIPHEKRSQSVQRNGQLVQMAKTAPQGGFFEPTTAEISAMSPATAGFTRNAN